MTIPADVKEKISIEIIKTLFKRFDSFFNDPFINNSKSFNIRFLEAFSDNLELNTPNTPYLPSLKYWFDHLTPTLGKHFIENIAHILSGGDKRENAILFSQDNSDENDTMDFVVDVFIEDNDSIIGINLLTSEINLTNIREEKERVLASKVALQRKYPHKRTQFYIGLPFDPTEYSNHETETISKENIFLNSNEYLIADDLWDFLSGSKGTMKQLLDITNTISTPEFLDRFNYIRDSSNRNTVKYIDILESWGLVSELELVLNDNLIKKVLMINRELFKRDLILYNSLAFNNCGQYNFKRHNRLKETYKHV